MALALFEKAIAQYIASSGFGTLGTNIFYTTLPSTPYIAAAVVATGGVSRLGDPTRIPSFTVLYRGTNATTVGYIARQIYELFDDAWNVLPNIPGRFSTQTEFGAHYRDANDCPVYTIPCVFYSTQAVTF